MHKTIVYVFRVQKRKGKRVPTAYKGWSDGNYWYYKDKNNLWKSIDPNTGLCVTEGNTKKNAYERTYSKEIQDIIKRAKTYKNGETYKECCERWAELMKEKENSVFID